jgi:hypothetical protein
MKTTSLGHHVLGLYARRTASGKYIDPAKQSSNEQLKGDKTEAYEDAKDWLELMISD